jgi:hypothetical protein
MLSQVVLRGLGVEIILGRRSSELVELYMFVVPESLRAPDLNHGLVSVLTQISQLHYLNNMNN